MMEADRVTHSRQVFGIGCASVAGSGVALGMPVSTQGTCFSVHPGCGETL